MRRLFRVLAMTAVAVLLLGTPLFTGTPGQAQDPDPALASAQDCSPLDLTPVAAEIAPGLHRVVSVERRFQTCMLEDG